MGAAAPRAVVFDLWNTIAEWPAEAWAEVRPSVAERVGLPLEEFDARWYGDLARVREMGPLADALAVIGASPETSAEILELRRDVTLQGLEPVPGAAETIAAMRERGLMIGLITVCSEDVPLLWQETAFHGLSTPRSSRAWSVCASRTRGSITWPSSSSVSSRVRRSSSATARTTSWPAPSESA